MNGNAIVIDTDSNVTTISMPEKDTLAVTRKAVRSRYVDVVRLADDLDMWIDDESMYNHEVNPLATRLATFYGYTWQDYYGPVLLAGVTPEGATVGLSPYRMGMLTAFVATLRES